MTLPTVILMYFGALIIPAVYLLFIRSRGVRTRLMLIGVGVQLLLSLAVWAFVDFSWRFGYTEYYWGWALLLPINVLSLIYFLATLLFGTAGRLRSRSQ